jgi:chromosome segregation ATPase
MPNPNERNLNELHEKIRDTVICVVSDQGAALGEKVGTALGDLQGQIDLLTGNRTDEVNAAIASVNNLVNLLDGDAETPGLQNLNKLMGLLTEYQTVSDRLNAIDAKLAEQAATLTDLQSQITAITTAPGGGSGEQPACDCAKIESDIRAVVADVAAMRGVDAAQQQLLDAMQTQLAGMQSQISGFNAALAANTAELAAAKAKAEQAIADAAALRETVSNDRVTAANAQAANGLRIDALDAIVSAISVEAICAPAKAAFRAVFDDSFGAAFARARNRTSGVRA